MSENSNSPELGAKQITMTLKEAVAIVIFLFSFVTGIGLLAGTYFSMTNTLEDLSTDMKEAKKQLLDVSSKQALIGKDIEQIKEQMKENKDSKK